MPRHTVLSGAPLLIAHRGGAALAPENTLVAFRSAVDRWGADMLELDVHASADGHCVVLHDTTVDRTTNGTGAVAALTLAELRALDAGYRFTRDRGATFPFRGRGVGIPTFEEVLGALPGVRLTVEVKTAAAQEPLFAAIDRYDAHERVIAAGMYERDRVLFGRYRGVVSGSMEELKRFYLRHRLRLGRLLPPHCAVVQIPEQWEGRRIVTPRFIRDLRAHGIPLHVWVVDDPADMHRLLDWGVAGLLTDRPDLLGRVLHQRLGRPLAAGHAAATDVG